MGDIMDKFYFVCMLGCCVIGAFYCGGKIADAKCHAQFVTELKKQTEQSLINNRNLNEKVYKTGVADIRRILQSEYTISE